jgi:hypothetical protein
MNTLAVGFLVLLCLTNILLICAHEGDADAIYLEDANAYAAVDPSSMRAVSEGSSNSLDPIFLDECSWKSQINCLIGKLYRNEIAMQFVLSCEIPLNRHMKLESSLMRLRLYWRSNSSVAPTTRRNFDLLHNSLESFVIQSCADCLIF